MPDPVISLTKKDFVVQTFRAGGKGGQKQNKTSSGVRIIHPDSGARGESREERSQKQNKEIAFRRLVASPRFKAWLAAQHKAALEGETLKQKVARMMRPEYLKVEEKVNGEWIDENKD